MSEMIPLFKRGKIVAYTTVDDDLAEWLSGWKWHLSSENPNYRYAIRYEIRDGRKTNIWMHREVLGVVEPVDHENGDGLDNRRENLRLATKQQNAANSKPYNGRKYKGVHAHRRKWKAVIKSGGVQKHLGLFDTPEEAALAYNDAAREIHGEYARLNNVPDHREQTAQYEEFTGKLATAMLFYMRLHVEKGLIIPDADADFVGVMRNLHEFVKARHEGDEREILAEGIGVMNHVGKMIFAEARGELEAVQDWVPILRNIEEADKSDGGHGSAIRDLELRGGGNSIGDMSREELRSLAGPCRHVIPEDRCGDGSCGCMDTTFERESREASLARQAEMQRRIYNDFPKQAKQPTDLEAESGEHRDEKEKDNDSAPPRAAEGAGKDPAARAGEDAEARESTRVDGYEWDR